MPRLKGWIEPKSVVLYRTPEKWRWMATDAKGGMLDGGLKETPPDAPVEEAQAELLSTLSWLGETPLEADWRPADQPDCWHGDVRPTST